VPLEQIGKVLGESSPLPLEQIGKIFGETALQIFTGAMTLYYALIAFARVRDVYFGAGESRSAKARKAHLEMLKLEAEIAACRRKAGLRPLKAEEMNPPTTPTRVYPFTRFANFVWSKGLIAKFLFGTLTAVLQLFGWLAMVFLILAARYWVVKRVQDIHFQLTSLEAYVLAAVILAGSGTLYLGFAVFGKILSADYPRLHRILYRSVMVVAFVLSVLLWLSQNKDLYPGTAE
jgi:hypothetical protein